ncbi:MAG: putative RDD family membrane protein YckC [Planctomycetota bacterium]|jgi:uncharacterized RDD family membrane protein YckC
MLLLHGGTQGTMSTTAAKPLPTPLMATVRTPEGMHLHFQLATVSERYVAMAIDLMIIGVALGLASLLLGFVFGAAMPMLGFFFLRHCYFLWFETRGKGTTFGKRRLHLRVIRADGGPLTMEILLARNLTRDIEFFVPFVIMVAPQALFADHEGLVRLAATLWVLVPLAIPFWHPKNQRLGDLLAGTQVIVAPPVAMLKDLADIQHEAGERIADATPETRFTFTNHQLQIYGEHELKVLEDLLRKSDALGAKKSQRAAAKSIAKRIALADMQSIDLYEKEFLQAFYAAQRGHLEQQLLLGKRRMKKREQSKDE